MGTLRISYMGSKKLNVLYLADPNSIHDLKWIHTLKKAGINPFWVVRKQHLMHRSKADVPHGKLVGVIDDFSIVRFLTTIKMVYRLRKFLLENDIHVFHIMFAEPNALWVVFKVLLNVRIVITCRGTDILQTIPAAFKSTSILNLLVSRLYYQSFIKADAITVTSQSQRAMIKKLTGRSEDVHLIRTGIDITMITEDTTGFFPLADHKPFILLPRFLRPVYNHEFTIEALKKLPENIINSYRLVFINKDDEDNEYFKTITHQLNTLDHPDYIILGEQPNAGIVELYKRASLVIMTPKSDGSPVSAMEVIAVGTPLILGSLPYDQDIFSSAFILQEWSVDELKDTIIDALHARRKAPTPNYLKKVDSIANMQQINSIYHRLT